MNLGTSRGAGAGLKFWVRGVQEGVVISLGNLVNRDESALVAQPGAVGK